MKKIIPGLLALLLSVTNLLAQPAQPSADDIMQEALQVAKKENKKVFIIFHASWCVWCHRMDTSMNDPACKKFFDNNFVIRHMTVMESDDKKQLENPGADAFMEKYHGKGQGIPFWLIFDSNGKLVTDSRIRKAGEWPDEGDNSGCPASAEEVEFFIGVLKKTTALTDAELEIIRTRFRKNES